jgi:hypothetical protein
MLQVFEDNVTILSSRVKRSKKNAVTYRDSVDGKWLTEKDYGRRTGLLRSLKWLILKKMTNTEVSCVSCGKHYETDTKGCGK